MAWVILLIVMQLPVQTAQRCTLQENSTTKGLVMVIVEALFSVQNTSAGAPVTAQLPLFWTCYKQDRLQNCRA